MTREQHLAFCKICVNRKNDLEKGILCGLTDKIADFEVECSSFSKDETITHRSFGSMHSNEMILPTASMGKRFINYLIDYLFVMALGAIVGGAIGLVLGYFAPEHLSFFDGENKLLEYVLGAIVLIIYYIFFEGFTGRSIGKYFTKTKVVTEQGKKPLFSQIAIRTLCRLIPFEAFSFLGERAIGWHDSISKTRVVEIEG